MPKTTWEQINSIIHKVKYNLNKVVEVERLCQQLKEELAQELGELEDIILQQIEWEKKNGKAT